MIRDPISFRDYVSNDGAGGPRRCICMADAGDVVMPFFDWTPEGARDKAEAWLYGERQRLAKEIADVEARKAANAVQKARKAEKEGKPT